MAICVGCGLDVNENGVLEVLTRPNGGIECDPDGADAGLYVALVTADSNSFDFDTGSNGLAASPIKGDVKISTFPCNGLTQRFGTGAQTGLFVENSCTRAETVTRGYLGAALGPGEPLNNIGPASIIQFGGAVSITNPTNCILSGMIDIEAYGGRIVAQPTYEGLVYLSTQTNGLGFGVSDPLSCFKINPTGAVTAHQMPLFSEKNRISFGPNETIVFDARLTVSTFTGGAGTAMWYDSPDPPKFQFHAHLTPTGVC